MKTLDIIHSLAVSLAALIAVIFAAGWFYWYFPSDLPLNQRGVSKSDLEFVRSFDLSEPTRDAEKAMSAGDLRLWPILVGRYPDDIGLFMPLYVPIGIWCEDPWKIYGDRGSYEISWFDLMFATPELQLVRFVNKYSGVTIIEEQSHYEIRDIFQRLKYGVQLRTMSHPQIEQFRDAYIKYATVYNQRILADHSRQIGEAWGYDLRCSPVTNSTSSLDIISATLYGERGQMRRSLLTGGN